MNKIKIMDQVNVYRDVFSNDQIDLMLNEIKKSEMSIDNLKAAMPEDSAYFDYHGPQPQEREDGSGIKTWTPWYTFGKKSSWGSPKRQISNDPQLIGYLLINNAISKIHDDYVNEYKDNGRWTYDIRDWSLLKSKQSMVLSDFEILKHRKNTDSKYTIAVHTDWHNHRSDEPGPKQIFTYTVYLNDDYEGGEVDFVDEKNKHLIIYKPKKGDITVFPSGRPFWHGARAVTSDESKYFLRTFSLFKNPINQRWKDGIEEQGPTVFMQRERERSKKFVEDGTVMRQVVFEGENPNISLNTLPIFINEETYIDGRKI